MKLADFHVESLGIDFPDTFPGYGVAHTNFAFCTYGIGNTEKEALDDCLDKMAEMAGFDFTKEDEFRIRSIYGDVDEDTTVDDEMESEAQAYFHVGIKWNEK